MINHQNPTKHSSVPLVAFSEQRGETCTAGPRQTTNPSILQDTAMAVKVVSNYYKCIV